VSSYTSPYKTSASGHQIYATPPMQPATPPPAQFTSPPPLSLAGSSREQLHYSAQIAQQQLLAQQQQLQHQQGKGGRDNFSIKQAGGESSAECL
jgi:hypothetical protein